MADFGDPSTWEMNVDQFIDSGLPKEKPPELLDIQEDNRKGRLLESLNKIGGRLEDSSLDFIRRENFANQGLAKPKRGLVDEPGSYAGLTEEQVKNQNKWIKANPDRKWDDLSNSLKSNIRKTGRNDLGTIGQGKANLTKTGKDSPFYEPLSKKGEKIAMKVYGTTDISGAKRRRINREETTINTKPVKMNKETDISVRSKKGQPVTSVDFKGFKMPDGTDMETSFMEDLKLRASEPEKAVTTNKYGNQYFLDKYPKISERQLKRAIPFLMKQEGLKYKQLEESYITRATKERKEKIDKGSSNLEEGRISQAKTKLLKDLNLSRKIDLAHRVSKTHMNRLGLQFDTNLMGMDSRVINQVIVKPSEIKLDRLYRKQFDVFEKLKNNPTDALRTELSDINKQVKSIVKTTSGRLVGVTIDPNTLETSFEGLKKKYSLTKFMDENITMKDLAKFDANSPEQIKFLTKQLPKAVNAEIAKGFVPNDFKQILSNKKSREAILKYAQKKTPELIGTLKKAFKNPTSKIAMRVLTGPIIAVGAYKYGENFLKGTGIVDREYEQTASTANAPIVEKAFTTGEKAAGAAGLTTAATIGSKATKTDLLKGLRRSGKNLLKGIFKVGASPTIAAGFAGSELLDYEKPEDASVIDRLNPRNYKIQEDPNIKLAGASLLAPEVLGAVASKGGQGILSTIGRAAMNPFGKAVRAFTPVGLATIAGGAGYDVYKEIKRRQKLTDEERLQEDIEAQAKDDEMMVGAAEGGFIEN